MYSFIVLVVILLISFIIIDKGRIEGYSTLRDPKEVGNYAYYNYDRLWKYPDYDYYNHSHFGGFTYTHPLHKNVMRGYYYPWM